MHSASANYNCNMPSIRQNLNNSKHHVTFKRKALTFRARVHVVQSIAITSSEPQTSMITIMSTN